MWFVLLLTLQNDGSFCHGKVYRSLRALQVLATDAAGLGSLPFVCVFLIASVMAGGLGLGDAMICGGAD